MTQAQKTRDSRHEFVDGLQAQGYFVRAMQGVPALHVVHPKLKGITISLTGRVARISYGTNKSCKFNIAMVEFQRKTVDELLTLVSQHATGTYPLSDRLN